MKMRYREALFFFLFFFFIPTQIFGKMTSRKRTEKRKNRFKKHKNEKKIKLNYFLLLIIKY
jgi:hypothetical protein